MEAGAEAPLDTEYDNLWDGAEPAQGPHAAPESFAHWSSGRGGSFEERAFDLEDTLSDTVTLRDHLVEQLDVNPPIRSTASSASISSISSTRRAISRSSSRRWRSSSAARWRASRRCLARLQRFDPPGVFARNLAECLALQLRDRDRLDPAWSACSTNLDLLARRDFAALTRLCGVDARGPRST